VANVAFGEMEKDMNVMEAIYVQEHRAQQDTTDDCGQQILVFYPKRLLLL
jgi:hypothetical protein